jgi:peptidoglycan/LPS O-acetylase OafA/YrhL
MTPTKYRPEIDGLRAISVLGVLFYHAGLGFPGGFIGVDVFFVISGYLISGIIFNDLKAGTFSLTTFWTKRIRRILPAVSFMAICVLAAGYFLLIPSDFVELARSTIAQALLSANIFFMRDAAGYFSTAAELKPLLHTWTLAVEEQFYLLFPLVFTLLFRFTRRWCGAIIVLLALASLGSGIAYIDSNPLGCFFLLPVRAWELLAGTILAIYLPRLQINARMGTALTSLGITAILLAMLFFDDTTIFPGTWALVPVLGAVAVIAGSQQSASLETKFLRSAPMVGIGLISYSLYLWHWPLFAFSKVMLIDLSVFYRLTICLISLGMAYLSWRFIENPFRRGKLLSTKIKSFAFAGATLAVIILPAQQIKQQQGYHNRFTAEQLLLMEDITWSGNFRQGENAQPIPIGAANSTGRHAVPDFFVWGDSHGMMLGNLINQLAIEHHLSGEAYLASSQLPVTNLRRPAESEGRTRGRVKQNRRILKSIIQRKVPNLILVGRWAAACQGSDTLVTDNDAINIATNSEDLAALSLKNQLTAMLTKLSKAGIHVWVITQVPESNDELLARKALNSELYSFVAENPRYTLPLAQHLQYQKVVNDIFNNSHLEGITIVDAAAPFFNNEGQLLQVHDQRSYYRDNHHLTRFGAEQMLTALFENVFDEMKQLNSNE